MDAKVIILSISGDMFLFKDDNFTQEQYDALQELADSDREWENTIGKDDEEEICSYFVESVRINLQIDLEPVKISYVVRIK